jgi:D-beta-D-heptose 7-phosphate kinase/D-beta-D-heptose 1-phosphate adenosyltransferase
MDSKNPVLKTLIYSDIFNFPLREEEIWLYLISDKKITKKKFKAFLKDKRILTKNDLYFLRGREKIVKQREIRTKESLKKLEKAKKTVDILSKIPSIYLIAVTGSLSLLDSKKEEDIDLLIITSKNTVWITRFISVFILRFKGIYRNKNEENIKDKICLNMVIGENKLSLKKNRRDLYSAHEVIQILPLFERDKTLAKFFKKNIWVEKFLPNSSYSKKDLKILNKKVKLWQIKILRLFEIFARKLQYIFMKKNITIETVNKDFLAFHARDYRKEILKEFERKIKKYE